MGNVIKPPEEYWVRVNHRITKTDSETDIIYLYEHGYEGVERLGKSTSHYKVTKLAENGCPGVAVAL